MVKILNLIGSSAVFLNIISLIPQIYKIQVSRNTKELSYMWLFISTFASCLWLTYSILINDKKLFYGSLSFLLSYIILIFQKIYFENKSLFI
jgi:uncharacterized protein with PQ loop repeat